MINSVIKKISNVLAVTILLTGAFCSTNIVLSATDTTRCKNNYEIKNPYESVDWDSYGQYKASLHSHSTESDGANTPKEVIEDHYKKGYDILAITDHDFTNTVWNRTDRILDHYLTDERLFEINTGVGRNGRGMIRIPFTNEQSVPEHLNTYWADFNNEVGATIESNIAKCEELGGISYINHPGDASSLNMYFENGIPTVAGSEIIEEYLNFYAKYPSCVGMEIFNKRYGNRENFRLFWDSVLTKTMPKRVVWGFSGDDTHFVDETGFNFNIMLMPQNTEENVRYCMENGTLYAVSLFAARVTDIDFSAEASYPVIQNILVNQDKGSITIKALNYDAIEWVADGKIIATGNRININDYKEHVNGYIRAQIKNTVGLSYTQPFAIVKKYANRIGDINADGRVNSVDFVVLKRHILNIDGCTLEGNNILLADVDGSGIANSIDLVYIKRFILGIISSFPS